MLRVNIKAYSLFFLKKPRRAFWKQDFKNKNFIHFFTKNFWIVKNSFYLCLQIRLDAFRQKPCHIT